MLFQLVAASGLAITSLTCGPQVLLSDNFAISPNTQDINASLINRQCGILSTQVYEKADTDSWQVQVNSGKLCFYPKGSRPTPKASLNHNFIETGEFHLRVTLHPNTSSYCFVSLGGAQNAEIPLDGISFRAYADGNVRLYSQGSEVTAAVTNINGVSEYHLDIYVSSLFNGSGATVHARLNGVILDLNGSAAGYKHQLSSGFSQNYITFGATYNAAGSLGQISNFWLFDRAPFYGASWWHGYSGTNDAVGLQSITELSPAYFQERIPFYGEITGKNSSTFGSDTQAEMDKQLEYAVAAGLDYIAWDSYPPSADKPALHNYGLGMYLTSPQRTNIHFCVDMMGSAWKDWSLTNRNWFADLLTNSSYFKVLDGRPLVFLFNPSTYGNSAHLIECLQDLRTNSIARGSGDPYFVAHEWFSSSISNAISVYGTNINAYCRYAGGSSPAVWNSYRNDAAHRYVPQACTGWDPYPRQENCPPWNDGYIRSPWKMESTPDQITSMLRLAGDWVNDYPLSAEVPLIHSFGWNDCSEGARVVPSLFKGVDRINAVAAATGGSGVAGVFESGTAMIDQDWSTVAFSNVYDYPPVVILGPPSYNGTAPVAARVRNVTRTNFQARVQEWECYDGAHMDETVHWLAIPPGAYTIDGKKVYAAKAWVSDDLRLFEDDFYVTNSANASDVNWYIDVTSDKLRQKGFAAYEHVINYVCGPNGSDWQQQLQNSNSCIQLFASNNLASISPNFNFTDTGRFRIETGTKVGSAEYNVVSFGSQYKNDGYPTDGFSVRIYNNGGVRCWSGLSELTVGPVSLGVTNLITVEVDTPDAFDGTGTAIIRLAINGVPVNLNGSRIYSRGGFADNFITLGTYSSGTGKDGFFYDLKLFDENQYTFVPTDAFSAAPVVLAQVETDYNTNAVTPRVCNVSTNGFLIHLQSQETNSLFVSDAYRIHSGEITGFLVIEPGVSGSGTFEAGMSFGISNSVKTVNFSSASLSNPRFFAALNTFNNPDPVVLRHSNLSSSSVGLRGQEEISHDAETTISPAENTGWLVIGD